MNKARLIAIVTVTIFLTANLCFVTKSLFTIASSQSFNDSTVWYCADGSVYLNYSISRNSGGSYDPSLALDSSGNPHIAWRDGSYGYTGEILYTRWNGSDWVTADGSVYDPVAGNANVSRNSGRSWYPSLALDSSGNPHIAWHDDSYGNVEILYTHWNGSDWVTADGAVYDPVTGNANVSRNSGSSYDPSLALDSSGNPHIVWEDNSYDDYELGFEILYTTWNGSDWVCADGTSYNYKTGNANVSRNNHLFSHQSRDPTLVIDSQGYCHVSWSDCTYNGNEIFYTRWNGSDWVTADGSVYDPVAGNANVSRNNDDSLFPSLILDSSGNPHIAWSDDSYGNREILYTRWNGSDWVTADCSVYDPVVGNANVSRDTGWSCFPSLDLDSLCNPHIAWNDENTVEKNYKISYIRWNGDYWVNVTGDICNIETFNTKINIKIITSVNPCLLLDTEDHQHMAFPTYNQIIVIGLQQTRWELTGGKLYNPAINSNDSCLHSLAIDSMGNPHIAWYERLYGILYTRWNGSDWVTADGTVYDPVTGNANVSRNSGRSWYPSLALDSSGNPHIAWQDDSYGKDEILYTRWNGSDWVTADGTVYDPVAGNANVSRNSRYSYHPSLALDSFGNPHITWYDESYGNDEIIYTHWNGSDWVCADGSAYDPALGNAKVSIIYSSYEHAPSIAINNLGNPHIVWFDLGDIIYTYWNGSDWVCADGSVYDLNLEHNGWKWVCTDGTDYDPATINSNISKNIGEFYSCYPTITLDSSGNPHIAWQNIIDTYESDISESDTNLRNGILYTRWDGSDWVTADGSVYDPVTGNANVSMNSGDLVFPSLALDSSGNPHIVGYYDKYDNDNGFVFYTRWDENNWVCVDGSAYNPENSNANVSHNAISACSPSLLLDSSDNIHIAWDENDWNIIYVTSHKSKGGKSVDYRIDTELSWSPVEIDDNEYVDLDIQATLDTGNTLNIDTADDYIETRKYGKYGEPEIPYVYLNLDMESYDIDKYSTISSVSIDEELSTTSTQKVPHSVLMSPMDYPISEDWVGQVPRPQPQYNFDITPRYYVENIDTDRKAVIVVPVIKSIERIGDQWDVEYFDSVALDIKHNPTVMNTPETDTGLYTQSENTHDSFSLLSVGQSGKRDTIQTMSMIGNDSSSRGKAFTDTRGTHQPNQFYDMLIVADQEFIGNEDSDSVIDDLADYARWKSSECGVDTRCVSIQSIGGSPGNNAEKIKAYVADEYARHRIKYLFLVGDIDTIECKTEDVSCSISGGEVTGVIPTDYYYSDLVTPMVQGHDFISELATGRLPVRDIDDLRSYLAKVIGYEQSPYDVDTHGMMLFCGGQLDESLHSSEMIKDIVGSVRTNMGRGFPLSSAQSVYSSDDDRDSRADDINTALSAHRPSFVSMNYHGGVKSIGGVHADELSSASPWSMYSITCSSNNFAENKIIYPDGYDHDSVSSHNVSSPEDKCFSEELLTDDGNGCISFIGNTHFGLYNHYNYGSSHAFQVEFYKDLVRPIDALTIGQLFNLSKNGLFDISRNNVYYRWVYMALNLSGDPSIRLKRPPLTPGSDDSGEFEWVTADGKGYDPVTGNANVSRNKGKSERPSFALDSKDHPHIVWQYKKDDKVAGDIHYVHWDGDQWLTAEGLLYDASTDNANISNTSFNSYNPSIVIDSDDNPHIVWSEKYADNIDIYYIRRDGDEWSCANREIYNPIKRNANASRNKGNSDNAKVVLDDLDVPFIVWDDNSYGNAEILCTYLEGSEWFSLNGKVYNPIDGNANVSRNSGDSKYPSLSIDSLGNPHITWSDYSYGDVEVVYTRWNHGKWMTAENIVYEPKSGNANISNNDKGSWYPKIALDNLDLVQLAWEDWSYGNREVVYTHWNGIDWVCADGKKYDPDTGNNAISKNHKRSRVPSIGISSRNYPYIAWEDWSYGNADIQYIHYSGQYWLTSANHIYDPIVGNSNVSMSQKKSLDPMLIIDSKDSQHIVWHNEGDNGESEIFYITNNEKYSESERSCVTNTIKMWVDKSEYIVDDKSHQLDVPPQIYDGSTFIPLRALGDALGCRTEWYGEEKKVKYSYYNPCKKTSTVLQLWIDERYGLNNGDNWDIGKAPMIVDGRTLVPLRAISEALGADVDWDGDTRQITIIHPLQ